jgi:hypothetical protein
MKRTAILALGLLLAATLPASSKTQLWSPGWDVFAEPLDATNSNIKWSLNTTTKILKITFTLKAATPNKLYQVGIHFFNLCPSPPASFGQFPLSGCTTITREGVTSQVVAAEFGVVTTDQTGNGVFSVNVGPIASGTHRASFHARNGAGCNLNGGGGNGTCAATFRSPAPFGTTTKIVVP